MPVTCGFSHLRDRVRPRYSTQLRAPRRFGRWTPQTTASPQSRSGSERSNRSQSARARQTFVSATTQPRLSRAFDWRRDADARRSQAHVASVLHASEDRVTPRAQGRSVATRRDRIRSHIVLKSHAGASPIAARVFVAWLVVAILTTVLAERRRAQLRHELQPARNAVPAGARPAQEGVPGAERRRRHDRVPHRERHDRRPGGPRGDGQSCSARCRRSARRLGLSPYGPGRGPGLEGPEDRVRDDQLRPARQPRAERRRQARARPVAAVHVPGSRSPRAVRSWRTPRASASARRP